MNKSKLGFLLSLSGSLLIFSVVMTNIANQYEYEINYALGVDNTKVIHVKEDEQDSMWYKSSFGDFTLENYQKLRESCVKQNVLESEEGSSLLMNKDEALPLSPSDSVVLLGKASVFSSYRAASAGNQIFYDSEDKISLKDALEKEKIIVNEDVYQRILSCSKKRRDIGSALNFEEDISFYNSLVSSFRDEKTCIVTISRESGEGIDFAMHETDSLGNDITALSLVPEEKDLLTFARNHFEKVIVLLNSTNPIEVSFIQEKADAILHIGYPGQYGFEGVASLLSGRKNPSGRIVDTYAVNPLSQPSCVNSGTQTPEFANYEENIRYDIPTVQKIHYASFQAESIYVGYKYYETRYYDSIANPSFKANSLKGSSIPSQAWQYENEVSYPFGYGLSYTTFEKKITGFNVYNDDIVIDVSIKNTGKVKGKDSVLIFVSTPYGDYEKENLIEKSAVTLVGYGKSKELDPNQDDKISIHIDPYLLCSYDDKILESYYLSEGNYYMTVADDAHQATQQILSYQGFDVEGDKTLVKSFHKEMDSDSFAYAYNRIKTENHFQNADLTQNENNDVHYLSRQNYDETYPEEQTKVFADEEMLERLIGNYYEPQSDSKAFHELLAQFNTNSNYSLVMMKDIPLSDTKKWRDFIFQMEIQDLPKAMSEGFICPNVSSLSPSFSRGDGIDSNSESIKIYEKSKTIIPFNDQDTPILKEACVRYASKPILTSTFNDQLYTGRGFSMGEEGLWARLMQNYCAGLNLHRTPFGGRNFEYISEDANLNYLASIPEVQAMEKTHSHAAPKHFAGNDQEFYREGVAVYFSEQAFREGSLRGFEGALTKGGCAGVMQSFERVGPDFASSSKALNTDILRNEWGFKGNIVTDAFYSPFKVFIGESYKSHLLEVCDAGTGVFCLDSQGKNAQFLLEKVMELDDVNLLNKMIDSAIIWEHSIATSAVLNGAKSGDIIIRTTPMWKVLLVSLDALFGLSTVLVLFFLILLERRLRHEK